MTPGTPSRDLVSDEMKRRLMRDKVQVNSTLAMLTAKPANEVREATGKGDYSEVIPVPHRRKKHRVDASPKPSVTRTPKHRRRAASVDETMTLNLLSADDTHSIGFKLAQMEFVAKKPGMAFRNSTPKI
jgi:hypothetical protein